VILLYISNVNTSIIKCQHHSYIDKKYYFLLAISLFGLQSGATLATVVGVLVPVMLTLVKIANKTRSWFPEGKRS